MTTRTWARYVRVSATMGREGESFLSPDLQRDAIDRMIDRTGGQRGPLFAQDIDRTGRDFNREGIQAAFAWVMEKPLSRGLACYDVSRLGRNTSESLATVKTLRAAGAAFASSIENIDDTPEGDLTLTIWLAMAEHYSARISRQWKQVQEHRAKRGLPHGHAPVGYTKVDGHLVVDPAAADLVVEVFEMFAQGAPVRQCARHVSLARDTYVPTQNVKRLLRNQTYIGKVKHHGKWIDGVHDPIIDSALWSRVQARLVDDVKRPLRSELRTPLQGLVRCGCCGGPLQLLVEGTAMGCVNFRRKYPGVERPCEKGIGQPRVAVLEELVIDYLTMFACWGQHLHDVPDPQTQDRARRRLAALERDRDRAREGTTRIAVAFAKGVMPEDAYIAANDELQREVTGLDKQIEDARIEVELLPKDREESKARVNDIAEMFRLLPPGETRERLRREFQAIKVHRMARGQYGIELVWR